MDTDKIWDFLFFKKNGEPSGWKALIIFTIIAFLCSVLLSTLLRLR